MGEPRYLIVNGDDFGQSAGINRGIIVSHESGILTSASLMVRWPHAADAAAYSRSHPAFSVGLHLDLGEFAFRNGEWVRLYYVVDERDATAVEREIASQLVAFQRMMRREPTHIDSHQHAHRSEPARSIVGNIARELGVPVRDADPRVRYCGRFYGQCDNGTPWPAGVTVDALIGILGGLEPGFTELGCHPATDADLDTMYRAERMLELAALCDARTRAAIDAMGIVLCPFGRRICLPA
jgi:predicted glycoside hydrolase/deacetylase ChbG (UPF0249 family)